MSSNAERVEIYSGIQRRRRYSVDEKLRILQEASRPGITISYVARQHGISPSLLFHWRRRMAEGGKEAIRVDEEVVGSSEVKALERRIRELERVLGRKTLENEVLREAVKVAHEKNRSRACRHCPTRVRCEDGRRYALRLSFSASLASSRRESPARAISGGGGCRDPGVC